VAICTWAICKPTPRSRQTTMPAPHHSGATQTYNICCRLTGWDDRWRAKCWVSKEIQVRFGTVCGFFHFHCWNSVPIKHRLRQWPLLHLQIHTHHYDGDNQHWAITHNNCIDKHKTTSISSKITENNITFLSNKIRNSISSRLSQLELCQNISPLL